MRKVALITGSNQGLGYGILKRLCKEHPDWIIYGTSRSVANGEEAAKKLKDDGCTASYLQGDITDSKSFEAIKVKLVKEHGGLDILVNNAGIAFKRASTDPYAVKAAVTISTNVFGTNMVCDTLFPILRDGARVVVMSSLQAFLTLHKLKSLKPELYTSFIKTDPPMCKDEVIATMDGYIASVRSGTWEVDGWPDDAAYSISTMANTLLVRARQAELNKSPDRDIVINAADPGHVQTSMSSYTGKLSIDEGADTPYYLAVLPPNTDIRGAHVCRREITPWQ